MNKSFWLGFSSCLFIVSVGIIEYYPQIADAIYSIPPTNAFSNIKVDGVWHNATSYSDSLEITTTGSASGQIYGILIDSIEDNTITMQQTPVVITTYDIEGIFHNTSLNKTAGTITVNETGTIMILWQGSMSVNNANQGEHVELFKNNVLLADECSTHFDMPGSDTHLSSSIVCLDNATPGDIYDIRIYAELGTRIITPHAMQFIIKGEMD